MNLYRVMNEDTPENKVEWRDEDNKIYNSIFIFKEDVLIEKHIADLFDRRIICEEKECNRYELLTEESLNIHKLVFHGNQHFEEGQRPIEHCCKKEKEKLKYRTLIEINIQGEPKYRDKYPNIKSFQNMMPLKVTKFRRA